MQSLLARARVRRRRSHVVALALVVGAPSRRARDTSVPYVPTPQNVVDRMLEIAKVGPQDYLIDLGSGDGRIVVTAASKYGARGFGVDLNPTRISEANENARKAKVTDKVQFYQQRSLRDRSHAGERDHDVPAAAGESRAAAEAPRA